MAQLPGIELRQNQRLVLTPQLQQAIKLLQYGSQELQEYLETELLENPLLERNEEGLDGEEASHAEPEVNDDGLSASEADSADYLTENQRELLDGSGHLDSNYDYENVFETGTASDSSNLSHDSAHDSLASMGVQKNNHLDDSDYDPLMNLASTPTLHEHIEEQINLDISASIDRAIAMVLLDRIDPSGWFTSDLEQIAQELAIDLNDIERILTHLQAMDPPGIFARTLAECLTLQLKDQNRFDPAIAKLIDNLDILADGNITKLQRLCKLDHDEVMDMIREIRSLNPKPGSSFLQSGPIDIIPDLYLRRNSKGMWIVELNDDAQLKISINRNLYKKQQSAIMEKKEREFLSEKYQNATFLIRSLEQRSRTLLLVASEIIKQQKGFINYGISHLQPMILKDISEELSLHESTISRVTTNKYIETPRGILELKFFFTNSLATTGGSGGVAAEAVRHNIKKLIETENPKKILSDDKIVDLLKNQGIDIARRTVAKYRESMRIPSSPQRKRQKAQRF